MSTRGLTAFEILEALEVIAEEENVGQVDVYLDPPGNGHQSEGDSGDEDCSDINRLSRAQLQANAQLVINRCESPEVEDEIETEIVEPGPSRLTKSRKSKKPQKPVRKWVRKVMVPKSEIWEQPLPHAVLSLGPESEAIDFFQLFFGFDVVEHLVKKTVLYATQKNSPNFVLSLDDMYTSLGIMILSGYNTVPRRRMYWERNEDCHNSLVSAAMRRNRFDEIFRYFHAVDNECLNHEDKMGKVRPLFDKLNEKFMRYAPIDEHVSVDESMIPYYGRHGCKQHIKGKPIRFGYKCWVAALRLGYCLHAELYQGRSEKTDVGLGESVIVKMAEKLQEFYPEAPFSIYCDNFFTSPRLLTVLQKKNISITGTVRANRTENCPLLDDKKMKKEERGFYDYRFEENANIAAVRWHDNSVVTLLSSKFGVEPLRTATRYSAASKSRVTVPQPDMIAQYNRYMGGVDRLDANVGVYRISVRGKKWYTPILLWLFDVAVNNATLLAKSMGSPMSTLDFRRSLATSLLLKYGSPRDAPGPSITNRRSIPMAVRKHNVEHILLCQQRRLRCAVCKNKTNKTCKKCGVNLHDKCFEQYHS